MSEITFGTGSLGSIPKRKRKPNRKQGLTALAIVVLIGVSIFLGVRYHQSQNQVKLLANPQTAAQQQVAETVAAVSKIVVLPANETPTLATVSDASKLSSQAFFAKAKNGDKVLIYTQAKEAILYRPSTKQVVQISPINLGSSTSSSSSTTTQ